MNDWKHRITTIPVPGGIITTDKPITAEQAEKVRMVFTCRPSYWSGRVADPITTVSATGDLSLTWPIDHPDVCLIHRSLLVEMTQEIAARRGVKFTLAATGSEEA
jgi:hypothetical protein